jgi:hypothetical protein
MLALLAVGGYARLVWGVPEAPYGYSRTWQKSDGPWTSPNPATIDPFRELRGYYFWPDFDERFRRKVESNGTPLSPDRPDWNSARLPQVDSGR